MNDPTDPLDPHRGQRVVAAGEPLSSARAAVILMHGRGASAENILNLVPGLLVPGVAYLAPQAYASTWYPLTFLSPLPANEPGLTSALRVIDSLVGRIETAGIPPERTLLLGFSQGACLATESAARTPRNYGAVIGFTGALLGPPGTPRDHPGSLAGVPVFLGAGDPRPARPLVAGRRDRRGARADGGKNRSAPLSRHAAHGERRRAGCGAGAAGGCAEVELPKRGAAAGVTIPAR